MNRYWRRFRQFSKDWSARRSQGQLRKAPDEPPPDPRAKSERHGKVTADKWNQ